MHRFVPINDRLLRSSPHLRFLMETLHTHPQNLIFPPPFPSPQPMYGIPTHLRPATSTLVSFRIFRRFCAPATIPAEKPCGVKRGAAAGGGAGVRVRVRLSDSEFRENWLSSLTSPLVVKCGGTEDGGDGGPGKIAGGSGWVLGIDPDVRGALAVLKGDGPDISAQVFDTPTLQVLIGKRLRKRLDPRAIVQLLRSLEAPLGTTAYIEQSNPFPKDGRQGWWSGGFGYGLWIGILVASGFSVVPIPSIRWKNQFGLSGCSSSKDDSRSLASSLFPSMSVLLRRKMDHGRAESLLIAAYGKGLRLQPDEESNVGEKQNMLADEVALTQNV